MKTGRGSCEDQASVGVMLPETEVFREARDEVSLIILPGDLPVVRREAAVT